VEGDDVGLIVGDVGERVGNEVGANEYSQLQAIKYISESL